MLGALTRLIELGVGSDTPLDRALAIRSGNVGSLLAAFGSILGAAAALKNGHLPIAVLTLACASIYAMTLALTASGMFEAARIVLLAVGCLQVAALIAAFGPRVGLEFYLIAMFLYAIAAFTRAEQRKAYVAYAAIATTFVAAQVVVRIAGPMLAVPPEVAERMYFIVMLIVGGVVGHGLHHYKNATVQARSGLDAANARITDLLANVLPPPIALRLQQGGRLIAESHGEATIVFADLGGFSALARRLSPTHLVELLNTIFSRFDEAAASRGIEKIKTIGDCYMAASGVLDGGAGEVDAVADFALDMMRITGEIAREVNLPLGIRIGISTGPVISGVIGTRRFSFDVWGDTVNLASRMESSGAVGRIQVSEATYWRLQHEFEFETRGEIEVKDLRAPAYVLLGRKRALAVAS